MVEKSGKLNSKEQKYILTTWMALEAQTISSYLSDLTNLHST